MYLSSKTDNLFKIDEKNIIHPRVVEAPKKGASYRRLRRLLRHLYIVDAVLEASGRQALLL